MQGEATRRREQELVKLRKDIELLTVQHESSEASLRKRHQEAINELNDQIEQLSKHRNKSVDSTTFLTQSFTKCQHNVAVEHRQCRNHKAVEGSYRLSLMMTPLDILHSSSEVFHLCDGFLSRASRQFEPHYHFDSTCTDAILSDSIQLKFSEYRKFS